MTELGASGWYKLAVRGILSLVLGVLALIWPISTLEVLVVLFGVYTSVDGGVMLYTALTSPRVYPVRGRLILGGIVGFAVGVIAIIWRRTTGAVLLYLIAARLVVVGVLDLISAISLRRQIRREWLLMSSSILSILVGFLLLVRPTWSLMAIVWLIAAYAIINGVFYVVLAWRLEHWRRSSTVSEGPVGRV